LNCGWSGVRFDDFIIYEFNGTQVFRKDKDDTSFEELAEGYPKDKYLKFYENLVLKSQE